MSAVLLKCILWMRSLQSERQGTFTSFLRTFVPTVPLVFVWKRLKAARKSCMEQGSASPQMRRCAMIACAISARQPNHLVIVRNLLEQELSAILSAGEPEVDEFQCFHPYMLLAEICHRQGDRDAMYHRRREDNWHICSRTSSCHLFNHHVCRWAWTQKIETSGLQIQTP
jgi:hypothetical protein